MKERFKLSIQFTDVKCCLNIVVESFARERGATVEIHSTSSTNRPNRGYMYCESSVISTNKIDGCLDGLAVNNAFLVVSLAEAEFLSSSPG